MSCIDEKVSVNSRQSISAHGAIDCPCCGLDWAKLDVSCDYVNPIHYAEPMSEEIFSDRKLYICFGCGFSYSTPFVSGRLLKLFYEKGFFEKRKKTILRAQRLPFRISFDMLARSLLLMSYVNMKNSDCPVFLDFGGGDGGNATVFKKLAPSFDCYVVESEGSPYRKHISRSEFQYTEWSQVGDESVDIIFSSHTLEHFNANQLQSLLSSMRQKLKVGGYIFIEVPRDDFRVYAGKTKVSQGCHLCHFTESSLRMLFDQFFTVLYTNTLGHDDLRDFLDKGAPLDKRSFHRMILFAKRFIATKMRFVVYLYGMFNLQYERLRGKVIQSLVGTESELITISAPPIESNFCRQESGSVLRLICIK